MYSSIAGAKRKQKKRGRGFVGMVVALLAMQAMQPPQPRPWLGLTGVPGVALQSNARPAPPRRFAERVVGPWGSLGWGQLLCMGAPAVHCLNGKQCNPPQPRPWPGLTGVPGGGPAPPRRSVGRVAIEPLAIEGGPIPSNPCIASNARPSRGELGVASHGGPYPHAEPPHAPTPTPTQINE